MVDALATLTLDQLQQIVAALRKHLRRQDRIIAARSRRIARLEGQAAELLGCSIEDVRRGIDEVLATGAEPVASA